jgi:hypothetical protein
MPGRGNLGLRLPFPAMVKSSYPGHAQVWRQCVLPKAGRVPAVADTGTSQHFVNATEL